MPSDRQLLQELPDDSRAELPVGPLMEDMGNSAERRRIGGRLSAPTANGLTTPEAG